jgi:hypothetical protein
MDLNANLRIEQGAGGGLGYVHRGPIIPHFHPTPFQYRTRRVDNEMY